MLVNGAAHIEETETQLVGRLRDQISRQRSMQTSEKQMDCFKPQIEICNWYIVLLYNSVIGFMFF
jgi:hypothetical protein